MIVDGVKVGCCAFEPNGSTLVRRIHRDLPDFQGRGLGKRFKRWQIAMRAGTVTRECSRTAGRRTCR
jgi:hypothetical protein